MPDSILTLLTRNLHDVFGENEPARRRAAIDEIFSKGACSMNPGSAYCGRDEIDLVAGTIEVTYPDFRYKPMTSPRNPETNHFDSSRPVLDDGHPFYSR
jgi:hypothetical protein